jgi:hypothetical protein
MLIVIIKSTRKPIIFKDGLTSSQAELEAESLYSNIGFLQNKNLASSGISVQLVEDKYKSAIEEVEIGSLQFANIPVFHQMGGF